MELSEITSLIKIREYLSGTLNNSMIDRKTLGEMQGMLLLVDKKIIAMLKTSEFKDYIDFSSLKNTLAEARQASSGVFDEANKIKSGLK